MELYFEGYCGKIVFIWLTSRKTVENGHSVAALWFLYGGYIKSKEGGMRG